MVIRELFNVFPPNPRIRLRFHLTGKKTKWHSFRVTCLPKRSIWNLRKYFGNLIVDEKLTQLENNLKRLSLINLWRSYLPVHVFCFTICGTAIQTHQPAWKPEAEILYPEQIVGWRNQIRNVITNNRFCAYKRNSQLIDVIFLTTVLFGELNQWKQI